MVKTFIVTGGNRGLGFEFVKQLAARGDIVFACTRNPDKATDLQALVDNKQVFAIKLDTTDNDSIKAAAKEIDSKAPNGVDVLINNAGVNGSLGVDFENCPEEEFTKVFQTNVVAVNKVTKGFVPLLRKNSQGKVRKILNMSSILGSISLMSDTTGWGFSPPYCVSKAALNMLTKMTANKLVQDNIVVYASHPGWCQTDMGGKDAPTAVPDSIRGQLKKLDSLTLQDSGKYFDYEGNDMGW